MKKIILILSGGIDSTTLLYYLLKNKQTEEIKTLSFDYGQKHKKELKMAKRTSNKLEVEHKIIKLKSLKKLLKSALTEKEWEVPEGHYGDEVMRQTVVPNRNMIMLSIAMGYAISLGYDTVAYAAHAGDHAVYPDCRPIFVNKITELAKIVDYKPIEVITPFINIDKSKIVEIGRELKVDYSLTWTCYKGKRRACGKCGACIERLGAFKKNNLYDPIKYKK